MKMSKLAELAGVSVSTVSKAFSGSGDISSGTREHVLKVARENGCYDKYCKRVPGKHIIAVICPEYQSGYYSQHLTMLDKEIKERGGIMIVGSSNFDKNAHNEYMSYFAECLKVDGMIIYGSGAPKAKFAMPIVVIGENDLFDSVCLSGKNAVYEAVKHFAENGHSDIAFIGEALTTAKQRIFAQAMAENRLPVKNEYIVESGERFEPCGYEAMNYLLSLENPPTAVLAAYDNIDIGAMKSIKEHGLKIPEDISVIGMDDNKENSYLDVPLTSITSYNEDLCQIVADTLFDRIKNGESCKPKKIKVSLELIKRGSVGKAKKRDINE